MSATRLPGTPRLLRALNDRAALELLLERGPLTRAQLGELTGLSKVTASQLVERLEERGLVARVGEQAGGRGPNAQLYAVRPGSAHVVGVDVGPDRVVAACADITGAVVGRVEQSTRDTDDPVGVVHNAVVQAAEQRRSAQLGSVRRIVLGTPGPGRPGDRRHHLRLQPAALAPRSARRAARRPAHPGGLRERRQPGRGGRGAVRRGAGAGGLRAGLGGRAASAWRSCWAAGCTTAAAARPARSATCRCPARRSRATSSRRAKPAFQQLVGADAVRAVAREHGFPDADAAEAVRAAVAAGTDGGPMLDELARRLALGVASTCVVLDPPLVVLAGEVGQAGGAALAERVQHEVAAITLVRPRVVPTGLTEEPILHGALRTALDAVRDEVFGSTVG